MDFHTLSRKELQTLCKKNKIPANMTNVAMANALASLQNVDGLEEFLNLLASDAAAESPQKAPPKTPAISRTGTRASARRKTTNEPDCSQAQSRSRSETGDSRFAEQENIPMNLPDTPAVPITRKRAGLASARRNHVDTNEEGEKAEKQIGGLPDAPAVPTPRKRAGLASAQRSQVDTNKGEKAEEPIGGVPESGMVRSAQKQAPVSAAPRTYSTRRSVRLLEKSMAELKLSEKGASDLEPVKMDYLGADKVSKEDSEEIEEIKDYSCETDSQLVPEESTEKADSVVLSSQESTGRQDTETKQQNDVNEHAESEDMEAVALVGNINKSDCENDLSNPLRDSVPEEKPDELEVLSGSKIGSTIDQDEHADSRDLEAVALAEFNTDESGRDLEAVALVEVKIDESDSENNLSDSNLGDIVPEEKPDESEIVNEHAESEDMEAVALVGNINKSDCENDLSNSLRDSVPEEKPDELEVLSGSKIGSTIDQDEHADSRDLEAVAPVEFNTDESGRDLEAVALVEVKIDESDSENNLSDSNLVDIVPEEKRDELDVLSGSNTGLPIGQDDLQEDNTLAGENADHDAFTGFKDIVVTTMNPEISEVLVLNVGEEDQQLDDVYNNSKGNVDEKLVNENPSDIQGEDAEEDVREKNVEAQLSGEEQNFSQQMVEWINGTNNSGADISISDQWEILEATPVGQEESTTIEKIETEQLVEVESEELAIEVHECCNSPVKTPLITIEKIETEQLVEVELEELAIEVHECCNSPVKTPLITKPSIKDDSDEIDTEIFSKNQKATPFGQEESTKTEKNETEKLVEVFVIESEVFATEIRERHNSAVETPWTTKSSLKDDSASNIQEYADPKELVDVYIVPEVDFAEGTYELPPSSDKTPTKTSILSPLALNKTPLSPLIAERLPKSPAQAKSSSKKQSTVRKMTNVDKENTDILLSPLAGRAEMLLECPRLVQSSGKKHSSLRRITNFLGDDKENVEFGGRKIRPSTEMVKKKCDKTAGDDEKMKMMSLRALNKMLKEELEKVNSKKTEKQLQSGKMRPALQILSENN